MKRKNMIKEKKGAIFFYLLILIFLLVMGYLIIQMNKNTLNISYVGVSQQRIVDSYELAERTLLYLDINAKLSADKALISINQKGGVKVTEFEHEKSQYICGIVVYPLLFDAKNPDGCLSSYTNSIKEEFLNEFRKATFNFPELPLQFYGYDAVLEEKGDDLKINVFSLSPIKIPIYSDVNSYYDKNTIQQRVTQIPSGTFIDTPEGYKKTTGYAGLSRGNKIVDTIVLHYTAGFTLQSALNALSSNDLSYHYIIEKDGTIYQLVDEELFAQHAGCSRDDVKLTECIEGYNSRSIGISFVNLGHDAGKVKKQNPQKYDNIACVDMQGYCWEIYTPEQISSAARLLVEIQQRQELRGNALELNDSTVIYHSDVYSGKTDPGPAFSKAELFRWVEIHKQNPSQNNNQVITQNQNTQSSTSSIKLEKGKKLTEEEAKQIHESSSYDDFRTKTPTFTVNPTVYYTTNYDNLNSWCSPTNGACITRDSIVSFYGGSTSKTQCIARGGGYCCINEADRGFFEDIKCQGSGLYNGQIYKYNTVSTSPQTSTPIQGFKRGQTATGTDPIKQWTVAVNPDKNSDCHVPYHTLMYVYFGENNPWNGIYRAEDTGEAFIGKCKMDFYAGVGSNDVNEAKKHIDPTKPAQVFLLDDNFNYIPSSGGSLGLASRTGEIMVPYAYTYTLKNVAGTYDLLQKFLKNVANSCTNKPLSEKQNCLDKEIKDTETANPGKIEIQRICLEQGFPETLNLSKVSQTNYASEKVYVKFGGEIFKIERSGTDLKLYLIQVPSNDLIIVEFQDYLGFATFGKDENKGKYLELEGRVISVDESKNSIKIRIEQYEGQDNAERHNAYKTSPSYYMKELTKGIATQIADCATSEQDECKCNVQVPLLFDDIFFSEGKISITDMQEENHVEISYKIYEQDDLITTSITNNLNTEFSKRIKYYDLRFKKNADGTFTYTDNDVEPNLNVCEPKYKHFLMCTTTNTTKPNMTSDEFKDKKILAIGDSITKAGTSSTGYVSIANELLKDENVTMSGRGYGSCGTTLITSCLVEGYASSQECTKDCLNDSVQEFFIDDYDAVLILAGINDGINPELTKNNLKKAYAEMKAKGKIVIAVTILPVRKDTPPYQHITQEHLDNIQEINQWIKTQNVDLVIDPYSELADVTGQLKQEYAQYNNAVDPVHPNALGHKKLGEIIAQKIKEFKSTKQVGVIVEEKSIRFSIKI